MHIGQAALDFEGEVKDFEEEVNISVHKKAAKNVVLYGFHFLVLMTIMKGQ
ncbi:hypothetical protein [Sphingobacterium sp. 2149]|uniref:hypothetical protein n=1 Tax=Sphingobacterium sp. 2149 TaxID=2817763 RepID=UPI00285D9A54|nr:hypothetical protein [Sphingobacterium sp. 2149]MDR6734488.1 hypothetical protein [Sphingobacterium sp. 2149]